MFPLLSIPNRFKLYLLVLILLPALCACSRERRVRIGLSSDELERLAGNSLVLQRPRDPALVIGYSRNLATARRLVLVLLAGIVTLTLSLLALGYCVIRLRQINRLANVTIVTQRRFLTNLSKEFRTPLNGVVGMTGLLLNSGLGGEQRGYGETVQDCAHSLLHMLNNLLDYSRMEEGAIILESLDFDLHGVVEDVVEHYAAAARAEGLEISCVIAPNVAQIVVGDPVRLRQVLSNLISNAVKFTSAGEVIIHVRHVSSAQDKVVLHFEVTDTGIGIQPADRAGLFESFSRSPNQTSRKQEGTGLGLAICRRIVDAAHGQIDFSSEPGQGTTFWVLMQFGVSAADLPKENAGFRGKRALLIASSRSIRRSVSDQITYLGMQIGIAEASQACELIQGGQKNGQTYHVIILDDAAADPLEFARELASISGVDPPRLLLLSGAVRSEWPGQTSETGIDAILPKPVRQSHLEQTLAAILQTRCEPISVLLS